MFEQLNQTIQRLWNKLKSWLDEAYLALPNVILALLVLGVSFFVARLLKIILRRTIRKFTENETLVLILSNIFVALFMLMVLFIVLGILNLDNAVTALLGTAGVAGLAVGLALQDPLINIFSGILMSTPETYSIDDLVETNGHFGAIQKITLRTTILLTPTGQEVTIPNKDIIQQPLVNYTRSGRRRIDLDCGISYKEDLEKVKRVATQAIEKCGLDPQAIQPVEVFFQNFGDSSIVFTLRFWQVATTQTAYQADRDKAVIALKKAFNKNGIVIPFPIRTLDFGIAGGVRLDEMYPAGKISPPKTRKKRTS